MFCYFLALLARWRLCPCYKQRRLAGRFQRARQHSSGQKPRKFLKEVIEENRVAQNVKEGGRKGQVANSRHSVSGGVHVHDARCRDLASVLRKGFRQLVKRNAAKMDKLLRGLGGLNRSSMGSPLSAMSRATPLLRGRCLLTCAQRRPLYICRIAVLGSSTNKHVILIGIAFQAAKRNLDGTKCRERGLASPARET